MVDTWELVEIDRFNAKSEGGKIYTVVEYQRVMTRRLNGRTSRMNTNKSLTLSDGSDVTYVLDDTEAFKIVETNEIIRRFT